VKEVPMLQSVLLAGPFPKSVILDSVYTDWNYRLVYNSGSVEVVARDGNGLYRRFCLFIAFELIQNDAWLHINNCLKHLWMYLIPPNTLGKKSPVFNEISGWFSLYVDGWIYYLSNDDVTIYVTTWWWCILKNVLDPRYQAIRRYEGSLHSIHGKNGIRYMGVMSGNV
jgi:hypothetical protein